MSYPRRLLVFAPLVLLLCDACGSGAAAPPPPPLPEVRVITVAPERIVITSDWIATLDGLVNAQIRPQVSGYLLKRNYDEGAFVRARAAQSGLGYFELRS